MAASSFTSVLGDVLNQHQRTGFQRAPVSLDGRRVLIVEDEVIVAFNMECEVQDAGGEIVGPAHTLAEAQKLLAERIDVAILDINICGQSVWPIAKVLRERGIPYVLASANCGDAHAVNPAFTSVPCFDKPVAMPRLIAALAALVAAPDVYIG